MNTFPLDLSLDAALDLAARYHEVQEHPMGLLWALDDPIRYVRLVQLCRVTASHLQRGYRGELLVDDWLNPFRDEHWGIHPPRTLMLECDEEEFELLIVDSSQFSLGQFVKLAGHYYPRRMEMSRLTELAPEHEAEPLAAVCLTREDYRECGEWNGGHGAGRGMTQYEV